MRVLFLSQVLPYPLDAGPRVREYYFLRRLAAGGHDVTLVVFVRGNEKPEHLQHLRSFCREVHTVTLRRSAARDLFYLATSLLGETPFLIARDGSREMKALIHRLTMSEQFDLVHADQLAMASYAAEIEGPARLLDEHNAVYLIPRRMAAYERFPPKRWLLALEARKMERYEGRMCRQFDCVLAVTEEDKQALRRLMGGDEGITVIPIAVDCQAVPPVPRRPASHVVLHLGTMFWPPNVDGILWFAREVLPLVQRQVPDAKLYVVGRNPPREVCRLQESPASTVGDQVPPVVVTGYVEDPNPYFAESAVFIVPIRAGGGMRVKILDAWARGIPVVSTTIGCEGIDVRDGDNILVADTAEQFAHAVVEVIADNVLAERLSLNGRRWVEERYDWRVAYRALDDVYASLERGHGDLQQA